MCLTDMAGLLVIFLRGDVPRLCPVLTRLSLLRVQSGSVGCPYWVHGRVILCVFDTPIA
jgi:hypothetical protein